MLRPTIMIGFKFSLLMAESTWDLDALHASASHFPDS